MIPVKQRILVVDDEAAIGLVLKGGLERNGFVAKYEAHSTDTIKACLEFHPDLILLDVDMPIKDGGQVAAELQGHPTLRNTPVIFLTSLVSKEETMKRNALGETLLSKPIPIPELAAKICAVLHVQNTL